MALVKQCLCGKLQHLIHTLGKKKTLKSIKFSTLRYQEEKKEIKSKVSRRKVIIKAKAETNKIENKIRGES